MNNKEIETSSNELPPTLIMLWSLLFLSTSIYMFATNNIFVANLLFPAIMIFMIAETIDKTKIITRYATVSFGLLLTIVTLIYDKDINKYGNNFTDRIIQDINAATVKAVSPYTEARLENARLLKKDPVTYVEETMAKLDMKLNEYERVNLKALEIYAKGNSEFSDERINLFKQEITDLKTSNYKSNFIRLTLAANTFSLETCNKYNSTAFCADLADLTIPQIEMSETIKLGIIENTGLLNEEKTEKYLDIFYDKLDKALDKRPDRVLTYREANNIFESIPTKQQ